MTFILNNNYLSLDQDTNQFFISVGTEPKSLILTKTRATDSTILYTSRPTYNLPTHART